ncbi:MAG: hypothetical protein R6V12_00650, partial [Candidatus Hydrogenedentota bacterium]
MDDAPIAGHPSKPAPKRRWPRWTLLGVILFVALSILFLATGYPQARLIEYAIHRATGFTACVEGAEFYPEVAIARLTVFTQTAEQEPVLTVEHLEVAYSLTPEKGRRIQSVTAQHITMHADPDVVSRIEALSTVPSQPSATPSLMYLPERIVLPHIEVDLVLPSLIADVAGMSLDCQIDSLEHLSFAINGEDLTGSAELPLSDFA